MPCSSSLKGGQQCRHFAESWEGTGSIAIVVNLSERVNTATVKDSSALTLNPGVVGSPMGNVWDPPVWCRTEVGGGMPA